MKLPRFIVVHTAPFTWTLGKKEYWLKDMAKHISLPEGFSWKLTYCDFDDNKFFCEWEAPTKEALAEAFKSQSLPVDEIHPVKLFNVAKADFE
jgi:hypothetical protein